MRRRELIGYDDHLGARGTFSKCYLGAEVTGDWSGAKQTLIGPLDPNFPNDKWTTKLQDLETYTVRLGYAANNWLFYGKVGGASGTVNLSAVSGPPGAGVTFSQSRQLWGSDFGGGVEYALTRHIILGAEYTSLDHASFNGTASNASAVKVNGKDDFEVQSVVGRLSYKFDWDRDRYVPLK